MSRAVVLGRALRLQGRHAWSLADLGSLQAVRALHTSLPSAASDLFETGPFRARDTPANTILRIVPQQMAYVVERFGKYSRTLTPGLHLLIPLVC